MPFRFKTLAIALFTAIAAPAALADNRCDGWTAAVSAAENDALGKLRGKRLSPATYTSLFLFPGFTRCLVGETDGLLLMCFLILPNNAAGKAAYADAVADMQECLVGWSPSALGNQSRGPVRISGSRVVRIERGEPLQALITLQGPARKGSTDHVVALAIGTLSATPLS
jgi:hypothetical protein